MADLRAIAHQVMLEEGFVPDVPPAALAEARGLEAGRPTAGAALRDLRELLWSSIDNVESRDLDQVECAEQLPNGDIRLLVGIADVDALAPENSAIDQHAADNTTSVYTGVVTFPMLPERLSTDLTSLIEAVDRPAVVIEFVVAEDGAIRSSEVYRAITHNYAKLDYESVGAWLEGGAQPSKVGATPGLAEQLRLQDEATERLRDLRTRNGALDLETIEANVVTDNGNVVDLTVRHKTRARYLIENLMIAANRVMATFLEDSGRASIQRVVRTPERWPRIVELAAPLGGRLPPEPDARALAEFMARRKRVDPDHFPDLSLAVVKLLGSGEYAVMQPGVEPAGHFGLAVQGYTHATAPNRRYADLIIQRLLKALLEHQPSPYSAEDLTAVAARCTERDKAAKKVERRMRKYAAVALMRKRIGQVFDAIVTGASQKGTYVRLIAPPVEGRVVRGEAGMDVGDHERVRLIGVDEERGYIDFARA